MRTIEDIRVAAKNMQHLLNQLPPSREVSTAKTKLDEAFLWAIAAATGEHTGQPVLDLPVAA